MASKFEFDLNLVEQYASEGLTEEQIAQCFGVSRSTITHRKADDSAFSAAYKRGQAAGIQKVTNALMNQVANGNTTAMIFFLKSRAGWKETNVQQFEGDAPVLKVVFPDGKNSTDTTEG